jgi:hypothetical protein
MSCLSSSPSLGLWSPVAIKISIFSLGIPLCRRIDTIFGSINWFGTGRVMSQMRMHALRQDFALSESGGYLLDSQALAESLTWVLSRPA